MFESDADENLFRFLTRYGALDPTIREAVEEAARHQRVSVARRCATAAWLDEMALADLLQQHLRLPRVGVDPSPDGTDAFDHELLRAHLVVPAAISDDRLLLAMVNPFDHAVIKRLRFASGLRVVPAIALLSEMREVHRQALGDGARGHRGRCQPAGVGHRNTARRGERQPDREDGGSLHRAGGGAARERHPPRADARRPHRPLPHRRGARGSGAPVGDRPHAAHRTPQGDGATRHRRAARAAGRRHHRSPSPAGASTAASPPCRPSTARRSSFVCSTPPVPWCRFNELGIDPQRADDARSLPAPAGGHAPHHRPDRQRQVDHAVRDAAGDPYRRK